LGIIVLAPSFNHDLSFLERLKPFAVQALIAKFVVKRFNETVLPGLARWNECWTDLMLVQPGLDGVGRELAPIVGTQELWHAVMTKNLAQGRDDILGADRVGDQDRETLACELVHEAQGFERSAISQTVMQDIVGPDVLGIFRLTGSIRTGAGSAFGPGTLRREPKIMPFPQAPRLAKTQRAFDRYPTITIARIVTRHAPHRLQPRGVFSRQLQGVGRYGPRKPTPATSRSC
jgi:hypothetical protein